MAEQNGAVARLGKKQIMLVRKLGDTDVAKKPLFQTDLEVGKESDTDVTQTKDTPIIVAKGIEYDFSGTCIAAVGDATLEMLDKAVEESYVVEVWICDLQNKNEQGKYYSTYYQTLVTSYTESKGAEDLVEAEVEFGVNGIGQRGWATVSDEQMQIAQYVFTDTTAIA